MVATRRKIPTTRTPRDFVFAAIANAEKRKVRLSVDYIVREFSSVVGVGRQFTPAYTGFFIRDLFKKW